MRIEMGTLVIIEALAASATVAAAALEVGFAALAEVAQRLHPEGPGSDLGEINRARPGVRVPIWEGTLEVLSFAERLNRLSDGIFDPCLPLHPGRLTDVELIEGVRPAAIAHAPLTLDCGGIAKGYAVDRAIEALRGSGCAAGLVNAGGDVRVFGALRERLLLRRADGACQPLKLQDAAVAVSDLDARHPPSGHRGYYVRSGSVRSVRRYAAIRAPAAMTADALTKCALLCPPALSQALLNELHGERLA
jgi:thiamine biosynthesis lipoprotein